jgi:emfourin
MKLSVKRGGGLAGIATRTELESAALPPAEAQALDEKVSESGLLSMPPQPATPPSHPDELQYELTVDRDGDSHTVRLPEGALPDEVRSLIEWADARPEREQRIVPPGGS